MKDLGKILLGFHGMCVAMVITAFFITVLGEKDEMEEQAINNALKSAVVVTILSLVGYSYYMLVAGQQNISINVIFFGIDVIGGLTLLFYFLETKGISFTFKIKNKKVIDILMTISTAISVLVTISLVFRFDFLSNKKGIMRYDELILCVNVIILGIIIPMIPDRRKGMKREEYKELEKTANKMSKIFYIIYGLFMAALIGYVIYRNVL